MKQRISKIILDTNLLLLWLVARTDTRLLQQFKRVQVFTYEDIETLRDLVESYHEFVTTPHVLSETSNFIDQAPSWHRPALAEELKEFIKSGIEIYQAAQSLIQRDEFNTFGLTDTAIAQLSMEAVVVTLDYRLAGKIEAMGGNTINFNHYRAGLSS